MPCDAQPAPTAQSHEWTDPLIFVKDEVVFNGNIYLKNVIFVFRTPVFGQLCFGKRKQITNHIQPKIVTILLSFLCPGEKTLRTQELKLDFVYFLWLVLPVACVSRVVSFTNFSDTPKKYIHLSDDYYYSPVGAYLFAAAACYSHICR